MSEGQEASAVEVEHRRLRCLRCGEKAVMWVMVCDPAPGWDCGLIKICTSCGANWVDLV